MRNQQAMQTYLNIIDPAGTNYVGVATKRGEDFSQGPMIRSRDVPAYFSKFPPKTTHAYICPAPRMRGQALHKGTAAFSRVVWADFDFDLAKHPLQVPRELLKHTLLVPSGRSNNYHLYVMLSRPLKRADNICLMNYLLTRAIDGDRKWADNSLMRLPGTFNPKKDKDGRNIGGPCGPIGWVPDGMDPQAVLRVLARGADGPLTSLRSTLAAYGSRTVRPHTPMTAGERSACLAKLPPKTRRTIESNILRTRGDVSRTFFGLYRDFYNAGLTLEQTFAIMEDFEPAADRWDWLEKDLPRGWAKHEAGA